MNTDPRFPPTRSKRHFDVMPTLGQTLRSGPFTFVLHPPLAYSVSYRCDAFVLWIPYGPVEYRLAVNSRQCETRTVAAYCCSFFQPRSHIDRSVEKPVEFLALSIEEDAFCEVFGQSKDSMMLPSEPELTFRDDGIRSMADEVRRCMLSEPATPEGYVLALGWAIVARLSDVVAARPSQPDQRMALPPAKLHRIMRQIESDLGQHLSVAGLAQEAGLSRSHFSRAFLAETGRSPADFIRYRRVCRVRELLSDRALPLAEIAQSVGFSSQSHMTTVFRQSVGTTPQRYRAAILSE